MVETCAQLSINDYTITIVSSVSFLCVCISFFVYLIVSGRDTGRRKSERLYFSRYIHFLAPSYRRIMARERYEWWNRVHQVNGRMLLWEKRKEWLSFGNFISEINWTIAEKQYRLVCHDTTVSNDFFFILKFRNPFSQSTSKVSVLTSSSSLLLNAKPLKLARFSLIKVHEWNTWQFPFSSGFAHHYHFLTFIGLNVPHQMIINNTLCPWYWLYRWINDLSSIELSTLFHSFDSFHSR